ncbi:MAG: peptide deformylase [Planctomycetes bacterium]|nr:peptide deformylase [Planctomycetota bacterium]
MEIVPYPHPALRRKSKPIARIDKRLRRIVGEMFELMYAGNGIGLAANQVGLPYRVFVANVTGDPEQREQEWVFINPEIVRRRGSVEAEEGCLSFPELFAPVRRSAEIIVEAFDLNGSEFEMRLDDLAARVVQHETDHLDGILFIDRMAESVRRELAPQLADFENYFRRQQAQGRYPADEQILRELEDLEGRLCA